MADGIYFGPDLEWQRRAECRKVKDPETFFPTGRPSNKSKATCMDCVVREQCLLFALTNDECHGLWGGLTEKERRDLKARMAS